MIDTKLLSQANLLEKKLEFDSAEKIYLELLAKDPNDTIVQAFLGKLYIKQKKYKGAERLLSLAYNSRKTAPNIAGLAFCKYKLKKYDEAVILYEELFRYDPDSTKIYDKIIESFRELKMYNFSCAYSQKLYLKHPDSEVANVRLTQSYMDTGDIKKAEESCAVTIKKFPHSHTAWIIAGTIQEFLYGNEELAQECYKTAIENGSNSAYYHLGVSYQKIGLYQESEEAFKKMIELLPSEEYLQASLGTLYLTQRRMKEGYEYFMKREKTPITIRLQNLWDGKPNKDSTLLFCLDQGYGDTIQYIRYLPFYMDKFKKIKVLTDENCISLFKRNYPETEFFTSLEEVGEYDKYVLASDSPYHLNMDFDNIPNSEGYLRCDEAKKEYFKEKYFTTTKPKIGLCWKVGGEGARGAINRTINIDYFKKVLELDEFEFYSLQLNDIFNAQEKYPRIIDLQSEIKTFDDTASILANLDILISADTSVLHLAGALGVKSYLLIPYCSDWRWFDNTQKTEWYDSVEIFKQQDRQDWFIETEKIYNKLKEYKK